MTVHRTGPLREEREAKTAASRQCGHDFWPLISKNEGQAMAMRTCVPSSVFCLSIQKGGDPAAGSPTATLLRLRPSHDARLRPLGPVRVPTRTSGAHHFHGVTGGVYKARERIHRIMADIRLLAIPASRSRVADSDPNCDRFCRFAPGHPVAALCTGHCSTCVAQGVRAVMI